MLKQKDFWIGLLVGALVYYLYTTKMKKGPGA
jgi:hypothetical protein